MFSTTLESVAISPSPLAGIDAFISNGVGAELVDFHTGLYTEEASTGWKANKQHATLGVDSEAVRLYIGLAYHSFFDRGINVPLEQCDMRI